jgi:glycosyltransferase involved in cell wall biosynthesis
MTKISNKDLTALMAVNKIDEFLDMSIASVLNQTYDNFYFLIVCNGTQRKQIAKHITSKFNNPRIKIYELELEGLSFALNFGINISKSKYIARQDADDISLPERFEKQIQFLEQNLDYSVVGSKVELIDEKGYLLKDTFLYVQDNEKIKKILPVYNPLCHPCLMFRRESLIKVKGYIYGYFSEDHDLFLRLAAESNSKFHNLEKVLFQYRRHTTQLTSKMSKNKFAEVSAIHFINLISRGSLKSLLGIVWVFPPVVYLKRMVRNFVRYK